MASRDINFSEFTPHVQQLLTQTLNAALVMVEDVPTTFCLYDDNMVPTPAEATHAAELIRKTLSKRVIFYGSENLIADTIRFMWFDIYNWIGGRDEAQSEEDAKAEYAQKFGVIIEEDTLTELLCLARKLCPHSEIGSTREVKDEEVFIDFRNAFMKQVNECRHGGQPDYGQFRIGIVVDGVLFDFPNEHEFIQKVESVLGETQ